MPIRYRSDHKCLFADARTFSILDASAPVGTADVTMSGASDTARKTGARIQQIGRNLMIRVALALLSLLVSVSAQAQTSDAAAQYPNRAVRIVVPFPPGGPTDIYARVIADKLQTTFGQPFVVENKAGATGIIGTSFVANAPADGYTLLFGANTSHVISPLLHPQRPLDPLRDFRQLSMLLSFPLYLLVNNDVPANTVAELVALAKAQPGKL